MIDLDKLHWKLLVTGMLGLFLAACTVQTSSQPLAPGPQLKPVAICTSAISGTQIVAWYAEEFGYFERYGLDVTLLPVDGGSTAAVTLITGDADMCQMAGSAVANAVAAHEDVVMIAGFFNHHIHSLIARSEIQNGRELAGERVGISSLGGSTDTAMRVAAHHLALDPDQDITMIELGSQSNRMAALEAGEVAAVLLSEPLSSIVQQEGYTNLLDLSELPDEYQHVGLVTTRQEIAEERETVIAAVKAFADASYHMKQDPDGVETILVKYLDLDQEADHNALQNAYKALVLAHLPLPPYPTLAGLEAVIAQESAVNPDVSMLSAEDLVDTSILEELEAGDFFAALEK
ncbi:MAG: ABC transporter substrate-binding protein [Candidatus Promineifilaceae bacterium]